MRRTRFQRLIVLWVLYMVFSLVHFIHNAEFLAEYPNLPHSWTRGGVYLVWLGMTAVGAVGLWAILRGPRMLGLLILAIYSLCGLDSLGHYFFAPIAAHSATMNWTILLEVSAAAALLVEVVRQAFVRADFKPVEIKADGEPGAVDDLRGG